MKGKKIIIAILCLLVAAAIALGTMNYLGVFEKETVIPDNRWTIRNLSVDTGDDEIAFDSEIRLSVANDVDENGASLRDALHFEIGLGDQTLIPVTAEWADDGLNFNLRSGGTVYRMDRESIIALVEEAMGASFTEEDEKILDYLKNFFVSMGDMMALAQDKDFAKRQPDLTYGMMEALFGVSGEDSQVEVDGKKYKARRYEGEITSQNAWNTCDYLLNCGEPAYEAYVQNLLDLMNYINDSEYASYADFAKDSMGDVDMEATSVKADVSIAFDKNFMYEKALLTMEDAMGEAAEIEAECILRGNDYSATMNMQMDDATMDLNLNYGADTFDLKMDFDQASDSDTGLYSFNSATKMQISAEGVKTDGLWNADLNWDNNSETRYDLGNGEETYSTEVKLAGSYAEALEEDQSITGAVDFTIFVDDADYGLRFELNRGKDASIAALTADGVEAKPLTMDGADSETEALLQADLLSLAGDAGQLMTDPGVARVAEMVSAMMSFADAAIEEEEPETMESSAVEVESFEEAAQIYCGQMPQYTAPEGYDQTEAILVSETSIIASYGNGDQFFSFSVMNLGGEDAPEAEAIDDGAYEFYEEGDLVYAAYAYAGLNVINFQFSGVSMEEAVAIINGLTL